MSAPLTYVYCLVRAARRPAVDDVPATMSGGDTVRAIEIPPARTTRRTRPTWLIVSSVPPRLYGEAPLERGLKSVDWVGRRALEHEAVVEQFLGADAVLPMKLFTLFASDERAIAHMTGDRVRIGRILARIERRHEWGVRLLWDERAARDAVERVHAKKSRPASAPRAGTGTAYLARKRDLLDVTRVQLTAARAEAGRVYRAIARAAGAARRRQSPEQSAPGSRLLLDAAFLVPVSQTASFRSAVRKSARTLGDSAIALSLTGPWPPYNFI